MSSTAPPTTAGFDPAAWLRRWDQQQAGYVPDRGHTFSLVLEVLSSLDAAPGRLLDLGCGPGTLAGRAADRFPHAEIVGLDLDPVMLELGRRTLGNRIQWTQADLRAPDWPDQLPHTQYDAITSATALHWLDADQLPQLTRGIAQLLRPGGVFANFDTLLADPTTPRLAELTTRLRQQRHNQLAHDDEFEDFTTWWDRLRTEPELAELFTDRDHRFGARRTGTGTTLGQWQQALTAAGFTETATLTQHLDRRLLVALR